MRPQAVESRVSAPARDQDRGLQERAAELAVEQLETIEIVYNLLPGCILEELVLARDDGGGQLTRRHWRNISVLR